MIKKKFEDLYDAEICADAMMNIMDLNKIT